jgi:hypothetical protein
MQRVFKLLFGCAVVVLSLGLTANTVYGQSSLLQTHPCGPDSLTGPLRKLIPQGAYGADFKPACRAHDACYDTPYSDRAACDRKYYQSMLCACESSRHPLLCRMTARRMYLSTHRFGEKSFQSAQQIAIRKLMAP